MKVRDVMQRNLLTVRLEDSLSLATQVMVWGEIRHLPVVAGHRVVGFLSERDLLARKPEVGATALVSDIVTEFQSVAPDDDLAEVAARMVAAKTDGFPVIDRGGLVGVVTTTDILGQTVRRAIEPLSDTSAHDIMTPSPETGAMDDLLIDAIGRMSQRGIRHLPVIDGDRHVLGMLSDRDVRTTVGSLLSTESTERLPLRFEIMRISDVVRQVPLTMPETASLDALIRLLVDRRVGAIPIVDEDDRLVGIVSYLDVLSRGLRPEEGRRRAAPVEQEQPLA